MQWTRPLFRDIFANTNNDPQVSQEAFAARDEALPFIDNLIARRHEHLKQHPQQPATTVLDRLLVMQTIPATCLSDKDVRNSLLGFFISTIDLTSVAIISAVVELLNRPAILAEAIEAAKQQGDKAIAEYVWEALRFRPPGTGVLRICTQDYTLARGTDRETQIKAGTVIYAASAAAMHDPTHIDAPAEFRVGRPQQSYLFFESGIHTCFGKYFSLVQIPLAIQGLLRLGQLEIAGEFQKDRGLPESLPMNIIKPAK
jgi:cytochrome P450